jgi:Coenzyme PQQ synthesis protein D (PqqD)
VSDSGENESSRAAFLRLRPLIPEDVARRSFPGETVLLNLSTGQYHGLNETGGAMVEELERAGSVGEAARRLAERYAVPAPDLEEDLRRFCRDLEHRGLLTLAVP